MRHRRLTISLEDELERAIEEAPDLLGVPSSASASERLRAYARRGYVALREERLERERLDTYRQWADVPELAESSGTFTLAASHRLFEDE